MIINTDCYLAVLKKYKTKFFEAHFEVITRTAKSCLSPSWELLNDFKGNKISFEEYKERFLKELKEHPEAKKRINELREIAKDKMIFLVCYEKFPYKQGCHRIIIKEMIENLSM